MLPSASLTGSTTRVGESSVRLGDLVGVRLGVVGFGSGSGSVEVGSGCCSVGWVFSGVGLGAGPTVGVVAGAGVTVGFGLIDGASPVV